mmetsp:Transcript_1303/g.5554  ORF Transcript_1303/g.5554 Transcript_1303/m.5554 type:complete len:213 (-) Transcript_1303:229-867(-)
MSVHPATKIVATVASSCTRRSFDSCASLRRYVSISWSIRTTRPLPLKLCTSPKTAASGDPLYRTFMPSLESAVRSARRIGGSVRELFEVDAASIGQLSTSMIASTKGYRRFRPARADLTSGEGWSCPRNFFMMSAYTSTLDGVGIPDASTVHASGRMYAGISLANRFSAASGPRELSQGMEFPALSLIFISTLGRSAKRSPKVVDTPSLFPQ